MNKENKKHGSSPKEKKQEKSKHETKLGHSTETEREKPAEERAREIRRRRTSKCC